MDWPGGGGGGGPPPQHDYGYANFGPYAEIALDSLPQSHDFQVENCWVTLSGDCTLAHNMLRFPLKDCPGQASCQALPTPLTGERRL
jgi:hypothetical protein